MQENQTNYQALFLGAFLTGFREGQEGAFNLKEAIENRVVPNEEISEAVKMIERMTQPQIEELIAVWPVAVAVSHVATAFAQSQSEVLSLVLGALQPRTQSEDAGPVQDS